MTDITDAAAQLQQWLDGDHTTPPPTSVVRTALWDLTEARCRLEQAAAAPTEVWCYGDEDEFSSSDVYADDMVAKAHAVSHYIGEHGPAERDGAFTWRESRPHGETQRRWLYVHGAFTGWYVDTVRVIASVAKASV
jgi:hypothetical protein